METPDIVSYAFLFTGLVDFIVIPRLLLWSWKRSGREPANAPLLLNILRGSGVVLIVLGTLFHFRIIQL